MNVKDALKEGTQLLIKNEVQEPEKSAEFLLLQVLGWDKVDLYANPEQTLSPEQRKKFNEFIAKRSEHQPVWYITGKIEFYGQTFSVNEHVLIPRPETEFLVEEVLNSIQNSKFKIQNYLKILDIGTGSGAIALAVASKSKVQSPKSKVNIYASDVSAEALEVAKLNAKNLGLQDDVEFREGNLLEPWEGQKFDIIVANLPYIPHEDLGGLALDIHHWEPRVALDGGSGGLVLYEQLLEEIPAFLNDKFQLFFEIGDKQGEAFEDKVKKYLPQASIKVEKDYSKEDRIVIIRNF